MIKIKLGQSIKDIIKNINCNFTELYNKKTFTVLYDGNVSIPDKAGGQSVTISLADNPANYDMIILQLQDCDAWSKIDKFEVGKILKPIHNQFDTTVEMKGWNMFGYNCEIMSNNKLKLSGFIYSGSNFELDQYMELYKLRYMEQYSVYPLTKVIGVKF